MKKRAHIPHNYEMSYEIYQEKFYVCGSGTQWLGNTDQVVSRSGRFREAAFDRLLPKLLSQQGFLQTILGSRV
jgi:hypothetical protein